jgi:hypothetical protein
MSNISSCHAYSGNQKSQKCQKSQKFDFLEKSNFFGKS